MKGQAFDTFKLLIAAVVAVAILGILLTIMSGIIVPGAEPQRVIGEQITKGIEFPHSTFVSQVKAGFKGGTILSPSSFTDSLGGTGRVAFTCSTDLAAICKVNAGTGSLTIVSDFDEFISACCKDTKNCDILVGTGTLTC